jgi:hypothetical protein
MTPYSSIYGLESLARSGSPLTASSDVGWRVDVVPALGGTLSVTQPYRRRAAYAYA